MPGGLSYPNRPPLVTSGLDGVYVECDSCHHLLKFLVRLKDGRQVCLRCRDDLLGRR